jgi:tetratricopeptide (TPR) repeat protein
LVAEPEQAQTRTVERSGADADHFSTLRGEMAEGLEEAWGCLRTENFPCSRVILNRLNGIRDLNSLERAQILHVAAALEAAQGRREEAIRILRDQIPALVDLSNEFLARTQGMLAGIYFVEGRYRDALDVVEAAIELSPNDSLVQMRDNIITARSLRSRDRLGESSIDQRNFILLDEVVE